MIVKEIPEIDKFLEELAKSVEKNRWFVTKELSRYVSETLDFTISNNDMDRQMFKWCSLNRHWEMRPFNIGKVSSNKITFMYAKVRDKV